ncbi:hypothetical protein BU26DRAFT_430168 [Trematosphaeria pertusa]|uniref:Conidiation protein 6 n=1 Tax=Trematosphaeria pertusa TaxID=390896 RepID=A0A6A6IA94_9PLEO|nr:uncharacterized protein BU26DRAFT_430168 [Trematosphaeria pertusa]KAF2247169.1 hypothetical protein BU26DRAFT_430168 [Trematosphaeria pertusa]
MSNAGNVIGGHKANLNNPNTSEEAKQHSREILENEFDGGNTQQHSQEGKNPNNVAGGLKATINNPQVSNEAKESAKERLNQMK